MNQRLVDVLRTKKCSAEEAVSGIKAGSWIDYGFFNGKPQACDRALAARKKELRDIYIISAVTLPPVPSVIESDSEGETFTYHDFHFSPLTRILQEVKGNVFYNPIIYSECERYYTDVKNEPDLVGTPARSVSIVQTSPMNSEGFFNFGLHNSHTYTSLMNTGIRIIEVNENIPVCPGGQYEKIHISDVTHVVEGEHPPLLQAPVLEPDDTEQQIALHVMDHISDGACVQFGIGGVPNSIGKMIASSDFKDLGCHTEMLVDSYVDLYEEGIMTGNLKQIDKGRMAYTFAVGGARLYEFMNNNRAIASYNVGYINDPRNIALNDNVISINSALQVDLYTQVNAESMGFKQISGNGGMFDFVQGAYWSKGGRSIICLPSTYTTSKGEIKSRLVPYLDPGTIVTVPRQMINIIATEFGWISLKGDSTWARAEKIISIAHPDFREELIKSAEKQKIWRRTSKIS
ncbi:MAG TPA: acetyl-CoA hydrolase/transferase C-terminal domain-containing protein [Spirochaetota bacterium]|nr:acetyl-CoA hydrolase/transferase C-terminal domain-containing protein [Spirochaetota bacterium]HPJ33428.1 acetyl-CoA hydrolase/transferase C-terminal domain-containing protein [Spirochaetota bacterium]